MRSFAVAAVALALAAPIAAAQERELQWRSRA